MSAVTALAVLLQGRHVADVERSRSGVLKLTYRSDVAAGSTPLSLSLPSERVVFSGATVEAFLWGLLPEHPNTREAVRAAHGADPRDPLSLLRAIGKDCAGAVQFCTRDDIADVIAGTGTLELATDAAIEARLGGMSMEDGASWTMSDDHWSLGGMQNKLTLRMESGEWHWAHGSQPTTHIVKPGIRGQQSQALVEHVSMQAARNLGLDAATTSYINFKSASAIVIERFDRERTNTGLSRLHQEDLCQALGVEQKYEENGGPAVRTIAKLLREQSSSPRQAQTNIDAFAEGLIYNTVIAAPDAHARNYSVLLHEDNVKLAPLYDVATGLAYDRTDNRRPLSMSIGGQLDALKVGGEDWQRFADDLQIDANTVLERVAEFTDETASAVTAALNAVDNCDEQVAELQARLAPALNAHLLGLARRLR